MLYRLYLKRFIDIVVSLLIIGLLLPIWCVVILGIKIDSPGPILFLQERLGYKGKLFCILKFRSMKVNENRVEVQVFKDNPDVTPFGEFLRRFKIDETPQILNVLKGDMSLIGPRPCLPSLRERFDANGEKRLDAKPGLSGLAQINGNIYNSWEKRWEYDAYYVDHLSFSLDFRIFFKTFSVIVFGEKK